MHASKQHRRLGVASLILRDKSAVRIGKAPCIEIGENGRHWVISCLLKAPYHYLPGDYLKLTRLIDDVEPGFCIYLRREGAWLVLCRAGLDEMDELCAMDKTARVHLPYLFDEKIAGPTHPRRDLIDEIKWIAENHFAFVDVLLEADQIGRAHV